MANQTLINLKKIYNIENDGIILELLRTARNSKANLDNFGKNIVKRKKDLAQKMIEEQKKRVEVKPEPEKEVVEVSVAQKPQEPKPQVAQRPENSQNTRREQQFGRPQGERQFSSQRPNNGQRTFNQNGERQFTPRNQNGPQGQKPQRDGFNRNGQQGNKPPFGNRPRPQGATGGKGTNFVSTKQNNFKTFKSQPDFAPPPAAPERTFGNKNKSPQRNKSYDQDNKKPILNKRDDSKRSVIAYGEDGFEETIMGSRKTIKPKKKQEKVVNPIVTHAVLTSTEITVKDLSEKIGIAVAEIVKKLMMLGIMANINSTIDFDTAELVLSDFGVTLELNKAKTMEEQLEEKRKASQDETKLVKRPPVVAVMGHVDHGKTSLLDAFRSTNVVAGEAGGITQAIGAYQISFNGEKITFIDTPGHAAFTAMRARGAKSTDIAILVVAADDGVMPQTVEAINHIKAAKTPMIVAINKMDKPEANPDRIKQQLTQYDVLPEEWGGNAIIVPISAKTGFGLDDLKQTILLVAEMEELKADPDAKASGVVLEAELDKNKGPVASILVQNGTLKVGDSIMSGITYGKVRAMYDEKGKPVKVALPSTPVSVLGFNEVPSSGDVVYAVEESLSKQVIQERIDKIKKERTTKTSGVSLDNFMDKVNEGTLKNLNLIIKADTIGSCEALSSTLLAIRNEEAKVNIIHSGTGAITESDIVLAETTKSILIAFNQKAMPKAKAMAESQKIEIKTYNIIYDVVDDITRAINGLLSIKYEEKYIGSAEIRVVFKLSSQGKIAGSYVKDGKVSRGCVAVVKRGDEEIGKTTVDSLKIVKDEKAEVAKGYECGIRFNDDIAFEEGDIIEFFVKEKIER